MSKHHIRHCQYQYGPLHEIYDSYHINIKSHLYFYTTQSADTTIDVCYRQFNDVLFVFQLYFAVFCRFVAIHAQITQQQKMYMHFLNHTVQY